MPKKIVSTLFNEMIKRNLYEGTAEVEGDIGFAVVCDCMTAENPEVPVEMQFSVQASSAEEAKSMAMNIAKEMDFVSCNVKEVKQIPNSDQELNKYGMGKAYNADPSAKDGQVMPSDVSASLPNTGVRENMLKKPLNK